MGIKEKKYQKTPLVSIITPCYNGESYLERYLESVVDQTYKNIELFIVNDGSTDRTEEIINQFISTNENLKIEYIYQTNAGQAAALNRALPLVKGKYIIWPDSDDVLHPDNIKEKVNFLENHSEYSFVNCDTEVVAEEKPDKVITILRRKNKGDDMNLFVDLLVDNNVYYTPGGYMIRAEDFFKVMPTKQIIVSQWGQNWQMLLPMAYHYKCGYLHKVLYTYYIRKNSHSRREKNYVQTMNKSRNQLDLAKEIVRSMRIDDEQKYLALLDKEYVHKWLNIAISFNNRTEAEKYYMELKEKSQVRQRDFWYFHSMDNLIVKILYRLFMRMGLI